MNVLVAILPAFAVLVTVANGDISGTDPLAGSCLCPNTGSLNIRDSPCGNIVGIAGYNQCFSYTGNKQTCTSDITYEFFEFNYGGQTAWAAGNYLNLEPRSYCTQYPCGAPQPNADEAESSAGRILGGTTAVRNAWPWQLTIELPDGDQWGLSCAAVLIADQWALTSASCVENLQHPARLLAGVYGRSDAVEPEQIRYVFAENVTLHPEYSLNSLENNIAIIRLTEPYDLSTNRIRNICLPPSTETTYYENPTCYITGFGLTQAGGNSPAEFLQRAGIDVIRPLNCELYMPLPRPTEVCTFDQASRAVSACTGDLGGPLSCAVNTRFQLAGIASYTAEDCNPRRPQVYTSIPPYLDWIREVTGIE